MSHDACTGFHSPTVLLETAIFFFQLRDVVPVSEFPTIEWHHAMLASCKSLQAVATLVTRIGACACASKSFHAASTACRSFVGVAYSSQMPHPTLHTLKQTNVSGCCGNFRIPSHFAISRQQLAGAQFRALFIVFCIAPSLLLHG